MPGPLGLVAAHQVMEFSQPGARLAEVRLGRVTGEDRLESEVGPEAPQVSQEAGEQEEQEVKMEDVERLEVSQPADQPAGQAAGPDRGGPISPRLEGDEVGLSLATSVRPPVRT